MKTTMLTDKECWLVDVLRGLQKQKFYGKLSFEFKEGEVVLIRKEETLRPPK